MAVVAWASTVAHMAEAAAAAAVTVVVCPTNSDSEPSSSWIALWLGLRVRPPARTPTLEPLGGMGTFETTHARAGSSEPSQPTPTAARRSQAELVRTDVLAAIARRRRTSASPAPSLQHGWDRGVHKNRSAEAVLRPCRALGVVGLRQHLAWLGRSGWEMRRSFLPVQTNRTGYIPENAERKIQV